MQTIPLTITRKNQQTELSGSDPGCIIWAGTQYDNNAFCLEFTRDDEYQLDTLVLYFPQGAVILGTENEYPIPSALTQEKKNTLEVAFIRNGAELEHSNFVTLNFRESKPINPEPPEPMQDVTLELAQRAAVDAAVVDDTYEFYSLTGETSFILPAGGGGGKCTVKSVNEIPPDDDGNVALTAGDVGASVIYSGEEAPETLNTQDIFIKYLD